MKRQPYKLKVKTDCFNKGCPSQFFVLVTEEDKGHPEVLHYAPNNWKTERGALNWAKKHGYEVSGGRTVKTATAEKLAKPTVKPMKKTTAKPKATAKKVTPKAKPTAKKVTKPKTTAKKTAPKRKSK